METKALIKQYIESHRQSWEQSTLQSERHRLNALAPHLNGDPQVLWTALQAYGKYSRVTAWTRVVDFWQWGIDRGLIHPAHNSYRAFRDENARLFKGAYLRKTPKISFADARTAIESIRNEAVRKKALALLFTGLRVHEIDKVDAAGIVVGKGGRPRRVHNLAAVDLQDPALRSVSYQSLYKALAYVGLKPHDLRKIHAAQLAIMGADQLELCARMGWISVNTATCYIQEHQSELDSKWAKLLKSKGNKNGKAVA